MVCSLLLLLVFLKKSGGNSGLNMFEKNCAPRYPAFVNSGIKLSVKSLGYFFGQELNFPSFLVFNVG